MVEDKTDCILQNQIEIMDTLHLLLRYTRPDLVGKQGELDRYREDLMRRSKATHQALAVTNGKQT